jgi:hypothetical protein
VNSVTNAVTFSNTGTTTLGDAATDAITFTGGVTAVAGPKSLGGTIGATNNPINFGTTATSLNSDTLITSGTGDVTLAAVDGAHALQVNSAGTTFFMGPVGSGVAALRSLPLRRMLLEART